MYLSRPVPIALYFKRLADRPLMDRWFRDRGVTGFSPAIAESDIGRPDLDFEVEVDAMKNLTLTALATVVPISVVPTTVCPASLAVSPPTTSHPLINLRLTPSP